MAETTITFTVPGVRCGGCAGNIRSILTRQDGVAGVSADPATKRVEVTYDPARATAGGIAAALAAAGYPSAQGSVAEGGRS